MQRYLTWVGFLITGLLFYGVFWLPYCFIPEFMQQGIYTELVGILDG